MVAWCSCISRKTLNRLKIVKMQKPSHTILIDFLLTIISYTTLLKSDGCRSYEAKRYFGGCGVSQIKLGKGKFVCASNTVVVTVSFELRGSCAWDLDQRLYWQKLAKINNVENMTMPITIPKAMRAICQVLNPSGTLESVLDSSGVVGGSVVIVTIGLQRTPSVPSGQSHSRVFSLQLPLPLHRLQSKIHLP